jgi:hypothetical protein
MVADLRVASVSWWVGKVVCGLSAAGGDTDSGGEVLDLAESNTETEEFAANVGALAAGWVAGAVGCSGPWDRSAETWGGSWCCEHVVAVGANNHNLERITVLSSIGGGCGGDRNPPEDTLDVAQGSWLRLGQLCAFESRVGSLSK